MFKSYNCIALLIIICIGFILSSTEYASAQSCEITICKSAPGAPSDLPFFFDFSANDFKPFTFDLFNDSECFTQAILLSTQATITEEPTEGWPLRDIVCSDDEGVPVIFHRDGIEVGCAPADGFASRTCTFINGIPERNIPTLSEWGMVVVAAGLGLIGLFFVLRRNKASAGV